MGVDNYGYNEKGGDAAHNANTNFNGVNEYSSDTANLSYNARGTTNHVKLDEKDGIMDNGARVEVLPPDEEKVVAHDLELTGVELEELEHQMNAMSIQRARVIVEQLYQIHEHDHNFPRTTLDRMQEFLASPQVDENPEKYPELVHEMKMEAILATENSPYLEVRANVDPTDDPSMPTLTFRVMVIGSLFCAAGSFIDTLFSYRYPAITIGANVAQLLAYPFGRAMQRLPKKQFNTFGYKWTMNPGPFNKKEHMLITIMANVSFTAPYTNYIIPVQALPQYFNQPFARNYGYQIINTLGTNFVGYGLAGLTRKFLVHPSIAVWPSSLATIGLNKAFHTTVNEPVQGPFGRVFRASREKFFLLSFLAMFVYFWLPGYLFSALSTFSWMSWIAPNNLHLNAVTGMTGGVGLNPWPTFDWNNLTVWLYPLTIPTFSIMNMFVGILLGAIMTLIVWYKNAWNTGYMPINSNKSFDNTGKTFQVSKILNKDSNLDMAKYQAYSQPWMSAGYIVSFMWYFALYGATAAYVAIFHRHEIKVGFKSLMRSVRKAMKKKKSGDEEEEETDDLSEDIHFRLMKRYKEVPEWQYLVVLLVSMVFGMVGVGVYPTHTTPAVLVFGLIMPLIVLLPCGLIQAVTGIPVPLNVLSEFIGGAMIAGNANALMYFKTYGYIAVYQALSFSNDLKLAHYLKIPPRHTFYMQLWATLIYCFVSSAVFNFAMSFKNVCTPQADFKFSCPGQRTFFTSAIFWGTLSPKRLFGVGRRYNWMLAGFPFGIALVVIYWGLRKRFPKSEALRQVHPVMLCAGPATWGSPYNMAYYIGNVYLVLISFQWLRKRYTAFWAKYNYVVAASFPAGIAIASIVIFFCLQIPNGGYNVSWWGNNVVSEGCEGAGGCPRLEIPEIGYFGDAPGSGLFT